MSNSNHDQDTKAQAGNDANHEPPPTQASNKREKRQSALLLKRKFAEISAMIEGTAHEARGLVAWKLAQQSRKQIKLSQEDRKQLDDNHKKRLVDITSRQALQAVKSAMAHKWAWPFNQPVDTEKYHDYMLVVTQPMDLGTIKTKCETGQYSGPEQVLSDVRLVFDNARTYNPPGSDVFLMAQTVQDKFMERWRAQVEPKIKEEQSALLAAENAVERQLSAAVMEKQSQAMDVQVGCVLSALQDIQHRITETKSLAAMLCSPLNSADMEALAARLRRLSGVQLEPIISLLVHAYPGVAMEKSDFDLDLHSYNSLLLRQIEYYACSVEAAGLLEPVAEAGSEGGMAEAVTRSIPFGPATLDGTPRCPVKFPDVAIGAGLKAHPRADLQLQDSCPTEPKAPCEPVLRPILSQGSSALKIITSLAAAGSPIVGMPMDVSPVTGPPALAVPAVHPVPMPSSTVPTIHPSLSVRTQRPGAGGAAMNGVGPAMVPALPASPPGGPAPVLAMSLPHSGPTVQPLPALNWSSMLPRTTSRLTPQGSTPTPTIFTESMVNLNSLSLHPGSSSAANLQPVVSKVVPVMSAAATPASVPLLVAAGATSSGAAATGRLPAVGLRPDSRWATPAITAPQPVDSMPAVTTGGFAPLVLPASSCTGPTTAPVAPSSIPGGAQATGSMPQAVHAMLNPIAFPGLRTSTSQLAAVAAGLSGGDAAARCPVVGVDLSGRVPTITGMITTRLPDPASMGEKEGVKTAWPSQQASQPSTTAPTAHSIPSPIPPPSSTHPSIPATYTTIPLPAAPGPITSLPTSTSTATSSPAPIHSTSSPNLPTSTLPTSALLPTTFAVSSPSLCNPLGMVHPTSSQGSLVVKAAAMAHAMRGARGPVPSMLGGSVPTPSLHLGQPPPPQGMVAAATGSPVATVTTAPAGSPAGLVSGVGVGMGPGVATAGAAQPAKDGAPVAAASIVLHTLPTSSAEVHIVPTSLPATAHGHTVKALLTQHTSTPIGALQRPTSTDPAAPNAAHFPLLTTQSGHPISVLNLSGPLSPATNPTGKPTTAHILPVFASPQAAAALQLPVSTPATSAPTAATSLSLPAASAPTAITAAAAPAPATLATISKASIGDTATNIAGANITPGPRGSTPVNILNLHHAPATTPATSQAQATSVGSPVLPLWHSAPQLSGITVVLPASGTGQPTLVGTSQPQGNVSQSHAAALQLLGHAGGRAIQVVPVQSLSPQQQRMQQLSLQTLSQHLMHQSGLQVGGHQVIAVQPLQPGQASAGQGTGQTVLQLASGTTMLQLPAILPAASHLLQPPKQPPTPAGPQQPSAASQLPKPTQPTVPSSSQAPAVTIAASSAPVGAAVATAADTAMPAATTQSPSKPLQGVAAAPGSLPGSFSASLSGSLPGSAPGSLSGSLPLSGLLPLSGSSALPGSVTGTVLLPITSLPVPVTAALTGPPVTKPVASTPAGSNPPAALPSLLGSMSSIAALASSALAGAPLPVSFATAAKGMVAGLTTAATPAQVSAAGVTLPCVITAAGASDAGNAARKTMTAACGASLAAGKTTATGGGATTGATAAPGDSGGTGTAAGGGVTTGTTTAVIASGGTGTTGSIITTAAGGAATGTTTAAGTTSGATAAAAAAHCCAPTGAAGTGSPAGKGAFTAAADAPHCSTPTSAAGTDRPLPAAAGTIPTILTPPGTAAAGSITSVGAMAAGTRAATTAALTAMPAGLAVGGAAAPAVGATGPTTTAPAFSTTAPTIIAPAVSATGPATAAATTEPAASPAPPTPVAANSPGTKAAWATTEGGQPSEEQGVGGKAEGANSHAGAKVADASAGKST